MQPIKTDILIIGGGPAGLTAALALSTYGIHATIVSKHSWLAHTPRAHSTNQRTFEIFRDLEVEADAKAKATPYSELPDIIYCASLAGEEFARMHSLGAGPERHGDYALSSPCEIADLAQNLLEPILLSSALGRGATVRFSTEYLFSVQDEQGVTATVKDRASGETFEIRARYMVGADGGRSKVAQDLELPLEGKMDFGTSVNIYFDCDLSCYVSYRPAVLYMMVRSPRDTNDLGLAVLRPTRRWHEWLLTPGYTMGKDRTTLSEAEAIDAVRDCIGDAALDVRIKAVDSWELNSLYATRFSKGRIFCVGDAVHRHVPSNGLGSNTAIQDSYNLAWKLALVLQGKADASLLESYDSERVPVGKQVVDRATKSLGIYPPILAALGLHGEGGPEQLKSAGSEAALQRKQLQAAIAGEQYEFNAHGVEMNQRYVSSAVVSDGSEPRAYPLDEELYYLPTTWPGARLPHAWLQRQGKPVSTLDLVGKGRFTILTGIGGEVWTGAASLVEKQFQLDIKTYAIGPGCEITDLYHTWFDLREITDSGCLLVRPDGHIAWRAHEAPAVDEVACDSLLRVVGQILGRAVH
ncbi:FAD-dependent monooxygenase [Nostoc sp.]|uniref:FAD-dependent monooxygenase n=1 Tax=Nostoc sp. TaxID=1180 RepID=UPI002FFA85E0